MRPSWVRHLNNSPASAAAGSSPNETDAADEAMTNQTLFFISTFRRSKHKAKCSVKYVFLTANIPRFRRDVCSGRHFTSAKRCLPCLRMKTEPEVYSLIQRLYADLGCEPAEILRVRPLYGGWYNALKYEVVRKDGTVTAIRRKDVEDSNCDAMADALKTFAAPRARACSCRHCGKWMHEHARYCSGCGNSLERSRDAIPVGKGGAHPSSRRNIVSTAAVVVTALTCAAASVAYWAASRTPSFDTVTVQRPVISAEAPATHTAAQPPSNTPAQSDQDTRIAMLPTAVEAAHQVRNDTSSSDNGTRPELPQQKGMSAPVSSSRSKVVSKRARHHLSAKAAHRHSSSRQNPAAAPRTVDIAYKRLTAAECTGGAPGLLCREKLRFRLCRQQWIDTDVPGMSVCRVKAHSAPLS
jgi:hypothetical protein